MRNPDPCRRAAGGCFILPVAFALRDTETGLLWYAGRVIDPRTSP